MTYELGPEAIRRLNPRTMKDYLTARGWQQFPSKRSGLAIFRRPEADEIEVVLPLSREFVDADEAMASAVSEIARFEERHPAAVIRDLMRPRADRLRFAVEGRDVSDGSIRLDDGLSLLSGSKKALLAAACSVERPQPFHPRMSLREAEAFVRACRLGQTEQGSFVATVECELDVEDVEGEPFEQKVEEPFGRKATTLLMRSVALVLDSIRDDNLDAMTKAPKDDAPAISANLCEALVEMIPGVEDAAVRIGSSWSPLLPAPRNVPSVVRVERQYRSAIEQVARSLRPSANAMPDLHVGKVDELQGKPGPDGQMQGEVVLAAQVDDEVLRMRLDLGPSDYMKAGRAHLAGQYVSVRGILRRGARIHRLEKASDFAVVIG